MFNTNLLLPTSLGTYYSFDSSKAQSEIKPSDEKFSLLGIEKTSYLDILAKPFNAIRHFFTTLFSETVLIEAPFKNLLPITPRNHGKLEDSPYYEQLSASPLTLNGEGQRYFRNKGYDTRAITSLSPARESQGKCHGAVNIFLAKAMEGNTIATTIHPFSDGVPLSASVQQELLQKLQLQEQVLTFSSYIIEALKDPENVNIRCMQLSNSRSIMIEGVRAFAKSNGFDPNHPPPPSVLASYVKECLNQHPDVLEYVDELDYVALDFVDYRLRHPVSAIDVYKAETLLNLSGLKLDTVLAGNQTPQEVLDKLPTLEPGGYMLGFPIYDRHGQLKGAHATGFVVQNDGTTLFYDPNGTMASFESEDRSEMIGGVFKTYTGYSQMKIGGLERIKRIFSRTPKYPSTPPQNPYFSLYKIQKIEG